MSPDLLLGICIGFAIGAAYVAYVLPWLEHRLAHRFRVHRPIRVRVDDR